MKSKFCVCVLLVVLIISVAIVPVSAAEQYTVVDSYDYSTFIEDPPDGVYRIEFVGFDLDSQNEYFVVDNVCWDLFEDEVKSGFCSFQADTLNYGVATISIYYTDGVIQIIDDQLGVDFYPVSMTFTPVSDSGGSGDFLSSVGEGLNAVIAWIGTVATSLLAADGSLNGLLPLVAVGIAVTALIVAIKIVHIFI